MTMPCAQHRCERGGRCYTAEKITEPDGTTRKAGAICDRPLCDTCERSVAQALDDAPALYVQLRNATLVTGTTAVRTDYVKASKGSPMPLNGQALHLGEQLWWLLVTWEDAVRSIAKLSPREPAGRREGRQVADAARLLSAHLTAWIAAPSIDFQVNTGRDPSTIPVEAQSGWQAAAQLLEWRNTVRNLPGFDMQAPKALLKYEDPCMYCGTEGVTHRSGDDLVQCQACKATWDLDLYPVKVRAFKDHIAKLAKASA